MSGEANVFLAMHHEEFDPDLSFDEQEWKEIKGAYDAQGAAEEYLRNYDEDMSEGPSDGVDVIVRNPENDELTVWHVWGKPNIIYRSFAISQL